ncbi:hypothetical protein JAAARDRAFT_339566 [Jaapia argillacea MUCL 33604]|uniref:Uncharacterized protein n=1 Tax=Jaapia argillacea MUCL 33604 TaxID=933084 RepID=A0A067PXF6_9AGAM|nr:hypothetical protein JAAARDRAFT_339566 [Jaapia argillacea MUCL 33604]
MAAFRFFDLPSVRKQLRPQETHSIEAERFVKWALSSEAQRDKVDRFHLHEMKWGKKPAHRKILPVPSHEYLILTFRMGATTATFRVERDTDSWMTVLGPNRTSTRKDTVKISDDRSPTPDDLNPVATLVLKDCSSISIDRFATLLDITTKVSRHYNLWTFNCWWFVGQLWSNLVRLLPQGIDLDFRTRENLVSHSAEDSEAIRFARVKNFVHLECLKRFHGTEAVFESAKAAELASGAIRSTFELTFGGPVIRGINRGAIDRCLRKHLEETGHIRRSLEEHLDDLDGQTVTEDVEEHLNPALEEPSRVKQLKHTIVDQEETIRNLRMENDELKNEVKRSRESARTRYEVGSKDETVVSRTTVQLDIKMFNIPPVTFSREVMRGTQSPVISSEHRPGFTEDIMPPKVIHALPSDGPDKHSIGKVSQSRRSKPTSSTPLIGDRPSFAEIVKTTPSLPPTPAAVNKKAPLTGQNLSAPLVTHIICEDVAGTQPQPQSQPSPLPLPQPPTLIYSDSIPTSQPHRPKQHSYADVTKARVTSRSFPNNIAKNMSAQSALTAHKERSVVSNDTRPPTAGRRRPEHQRHKSTAY